MAKPSGKAIDWNNLKRLAGYVKPYKRLLYLTILFIILLSVVAVIRPWLLSKAIDEQILRSKNISMLVTVCVIVGVLIVLEACLQYFQSLLSGKLGLSVTADLRKHIYNHIINLRLKYYDKNPIGMLVTRVVSDIETVNDIFTEGLIIIFGDLLKLIAVLAIMFYTNWLLTLYVLIPIPLLLIATNIFKNVTRKSFQDVRGEVARINTFVQEHITGMALVQLFNRQDSEYQKFDEINKKHRDAHIRGVMAYSIFFPVVDILSAMSLGFLIWLGASQAIQQQLSLGELVAFIMYIGLLYRPIRQLADRFNTLQMGMVGCERVFNVLDTKEFVEQQNAREPSAHEIHITFDELKFGYNTGSTVLNGISFEVASGTTTALVGATGSGKTSIISLLARLYEYNSGSIKINGIEIRNISETWLRTNTVFVLQEVNLFADTVYNNLTLFNPAITKQQVIEAGKKLGIHDFIMRLEGGYDHFLAERGNNLSSGQKQLLSILRAYVHDPRLLVFDEATSSVDSETEHIIQQAITELTRNRTCIIIAHRLSTVRNADQIIVLDKGNIVEKGTPSELLKAAGVYARLYKMQFEFSE
ncbi:MAG TPA: ABC transporter ATP-binding protein [Flavobacteriales bacterium]|nr:ABC transporter ATP-binding protein [Flavobacteriales bacterium]